MDIKRRKDPVEVQESDILRCGSCGLDLPAGSFVRDKTRVSRGGYSFCCQPCSRARLKKYKPTQSSLLNKENARLQRKYGISLEVYNRILKLQNEVCAICGLKDNHKALAVDHDHLTGEVRGLLCFSCNTALGKFNDNEVILMKAIKYLKRSSPATPDWI